MSKKTPLPAAAPVPYHHGDLRRALVDAGIILIAETQKWDFSLREVARRANVSHNAPYSHFSDRQDLLAAIAVAGYESLSARMFSASSNSATARDALKQIGIAYLHFGIENPSHYRLMFGQTLHQPEGGYPATVNIAATASRAQLKNVIMQGSVDGTFRIEPENEVAIAAGVMAAWSLIHGLTLLHIDGLTKLEAEIEIDTLLEMISSLFSHGLMT
jgi:AcrR family transcriptional regulator